MKYLRLLLALVLTGAVAVLALRVHNGVESDLYGLADAGGALGKIAKGMATQGRVLLEGSDFETLKAEAERVCEELEQKPKTDFKEVLKFIDAHKTGLLASGTRELLQAGKYREVADGALARLFSPTPRLLRVKDDPFLLATEYVTALQTNLAGDWSLRDGFVTCERNGLVYILLSLDLAAVSAEKVAGFVTSAATNKPINQLTNKPIKHYPGGAAFHSAVATVRSKSEIGILSGVSVACVLGLGWLLFRSFKFLPMLLMAQAAAFLVATAALFAAYGRPHVLTFVFGTSLIGLSVDYVYHVCMAGSAKKIMCALTLSLITTIACFAPLLFADVIVLRQMALFSITGLVAAYLTVLARGKIKNEELRIKNDLGDDCGMLRGMPPPPRSNSTPNTKHPTPKRVVIVLLMALIIPGLFRARVVSDPASFYKPDEFLLESEKKIAELSPGNAQRFVFVPGATLQEALENEEAAGVRGLSAVIPSLKRQHENAALKAKLAAAEGARYAAQTGLKMPAGEAGEFLDAGSVAEGSLADMVRAMWVGGGLVSPLSAGSEAPPGVEVLDPRTALENLFVRFTSATLKLLAVSFAAFVLMLAIVFRGRMLRYLLPVVISLAATAGALGWIGVPFTFFTLLCFFVLAGLGIDYVIFMAGDSSVAMRRTVSYSFLTSFVGLGILAFTAFPVTQTMGMTFAIGLAFARLAAGAVGNNH